MDGTTKEARKRAGCAVTVAAGVVMLRLGVHHELQVMELFAKPQTMSQQTTNIRQEECLYRAIRAQVPKGAHVYVNSQDWHYAQRLAELSTSWAVPEANLANARYKLAMIPADGHCYGLALKVSLV